MSINKDKGNSDLKPAQSVTEETKLESEEDRKNKSSNSQGEDQAETKISKEDNDKKWDRDSRLPPQMMKRWFGGGP